MLDLVMLIVIGISFAGSCRLCELLRAHARSWQLPSGQPAVTWHGWAQIAVFAALITAAVKPLGGYIARVVEGCLRLPRSLAVVENGIYRLAGVDPNEEQGWRTYALGCVTMGRRRRCIPSG
jgi:hypothetical protein